jgi:excisionase family DNA binding protein
VTTPRNGSQRTGESDGSNVPSSNHVDSETVTMLTAPQLAERWQVPVRTIYAWAKRNEIPHYRAGRLLRFDPDEVEEHCRRAGFAEEIVPDDEHPGESAFALLSA